VTSVNAMTVMKSFAAEFCMSTSSSCTAGKHKHLHTGN
jgi:hypothetical protein